MLAAVSEESLNLSDRLRQCGYESCGRPRNQDYGRAAALARLETHLNETVKESATDDWPYLYLRSPSVPFAYFWTFGALFLAGAVSLVGSRG